MQATFRHPLNSTRDTVTAWTTCVPALLLGPVYFTFVGAWLVAAVLWLVTLAAILAASTATVTLAVASWVLCALLAWRIRAHLYRRRGWVEVAKTCRAPSQQPNASPVAAVKGGN
ncbi:MAG: hypothetical protein NW223_06300 [Hyphomicrobiaceae bacterium]|nr:hypothetical protein [Hyphomicrobiaceae bacterium]